MYANALLKRCFLITLLVCSASLAQAMPSDERILAARDAFNRGDSAGLENMLLTPSDHVLEPYIRYWAFSMAFKTNQVVDEANLSTFLEREQNSYLADRLRILWAKRLMKEKDYSRFLTLATQIQEPDAEMRCDMLTARQNTGDMQIQQEIAKNWQELVSAPSNCDPVLAAAVAGGYVKEDKVWWRFQRLVALKKISNAQSTLGFLAADVAPLNTEANKALNQPANYLDKAPLSTTQTRTGRELIIAALTRLSREDTGKAILRMTRWEDVLTSGEKEYVYGMLCWRTAFIQNPIAAEYCKRAGQAELNSEAAEWRVRAALRSGDWPQVSTAILGLAPSERTKPEWVYWLGRAYEAQGQKEAAQAEFKKNAGSSNFYGILSAEALDRSFLPNTLSTAAPESDRQRAEQDIGLRRAIAFYRLDLRTEGGREWNFAIQKQSPAFLAAAARLALNEQLYDRTIYTADRADPNANYDLRYLAPYRNIIEPEVTNQALPLSWVYGLMRQESRFIAPARSPVGAQGLMQVMPATGRWVAQKLGLTDYDSSWLTDPNRNVQLGTSYMRMILDDLYQHPVLASAGYNAGPGRARRWRDDKALEGAVYIETIPFEETRDYVKKVMANTVVYSALFSGKADSLKKWLGTIGARNEATQPSGLSNVIETSSESSE